MQFLICFSIWPFSGCSFSSCSVCVVRCGGLCPDHDVSVVAHCAMASPASRVSILESWRRPVCQDCQRNFMGLQNTSHWPGHSGQLGLSRGRVRKTECQLKCRECQEESVWCVMCDDKHDKHDKHDDVSQDDEVESVEGTEYVLMWTDCYRWG